MITFVPATMMLLNQKVNDMSNLLVFRIPVLTLQKGISTSFVKSLFMLSLFIGISNIAQAQTNGDSYKTAIGVKFYPAGVTIKTFMKPNLAFEARGYFWERGTRITGLFEYHNLYMMISIGKDQLIFHLLFYLPQNILQKFFSFRVSKILIYL
jgi:hypothetical protein